MCFEQASAISGRFIYRGWLRGKRTCWNKLLEDESQFPRTLGASHSLRKISSHTERTIYLLQVFVGRCAAGILWVVGVRRYLALIFYHIGKYTTQAMHL